VIYQFLRCIALNGINVVARNPDLLDRSILLPLNAINPDERRNEKQYWSDFERLRPSLFGAMLDALSKAMNMIHTVELSVLPRMADFAQWGCAIAESIGYSQKDFLEAYSENAGLGHEEVMASCQVAYAIQCLMQERNEGNGTPHELYRELQSIAEENKINVRAKDWPKAANALTRRLNELAPTLLTTGLKVDVGGRTGRGRRVVIRKVMENTVTTVISSPSKVSSQPKPHDHNELEECDDSDDNSRAAIAGNCKQDSAVHPSNPVSNMEADPPEWLRTVSRNLKKIKQRRQAEDREVMEI
jgi:hypothetical protein